MATAERYLKAEQEPHKFLKIRTQSELRHMMFIYLSKKEI